MEMATSTLVVQAQLHDTVPERFPLLIQLSVLELGEAWFLWLGACNHGLGVAALVLL